MFETPAFFEPYNNVYKYLDTYGEDMLPMKQYIIDSEVMLLHYFNLS